MSEFKFKSNPKSIHLNSVITDTLPMAFCGGGEAFCEGEVTVCYADGEQDTIYLDVMTNLCRECDPDEEECDCTTVSGEEELSKLPDDEFMYAISHSSFDWEKRDINHDETPLNYDSMKEAFASPYLGDILRKLTVEFAGFCGYWKTSAETADKEPDKE